MTLIASNKSHESELASGERFPFGKNWARFLEVLDEPRIQEAENNLKRMLEVDRLDGLSFLDIGSGSGLSSLAARRMGARVLSFDFDPQSVACTKEPRRRYFDRDKNWEITTGSALDSTFLNGLGTFDVVYSWGVLHHTGAMWQALANVDGNVAPNGKLFVSLYNDQGGASRRWLLVKKTYNRLPAPLRLPFAFLVYLPLELKGFAGQLLRGTPHRYFSYISNYRQQRGMSWWHDMIDWIGGYPFEVAKPEQVFEFYKIRGYSLLSLTTCGPGHGCNEFAFQRQERSG